MLNFKKIPEMNVIYLDYVVNTMPCYRPECHVDSPCKFCRGSLEVYYDDSSKSHKARNNS